MTSGPPTSKLSPSASGRPATPGRSRTLSVRAIGWVGVASHRGGRHRNGSGREDGAGLGPAPQVGREVWPVIAEPAEIDDLSDARPLGLRDDVRGHPPVELGEVARAERMDEVIGDVDALERAARRLAVGEVGGDRANSRQVGRVRPSRDSDDLAALRERRNERAPDEPGGSQDSGSHSGSLAP